MALITPWRFPIIDNWILSTPRLVVNPKLLCPLLTKYYQPAHVIMGEGPHQRNNRNDPARGTHYSACGVYYATRGPLYTGGRGGPKISMNLNLELKLVSNYGASIYDYPQIFWIYPLSYPPFHATSLTGFPYYVCFSRDPPSGLLSLWFVVPLTFCFLWGCVRLGEATQTKMCSPQQVMFTFLS